MRWVLVMSILAACASRRAPASKTAPDAAPAPPGITVERIATGIAASDEGDGRVTMVRVDLARYELGVYGAADAPLAADKWAEEHDLVAVINSSMFAPSGRSIGLLVDGDGDYGAHDNS